jgi:3-oxoacyl-[acyl-carrier protein] reductase
MSSAKRAALITGGSRGIGLGIAKCLAKEGFDLAINGLREETAVAGALEELRSLGAEAVYVLGDISVAENRSRILATIKARFNRLDLLVNNAGVAPDVRADILDATEQSFERLIRINLQGPYFLTQLAARWMIEQKEADPAFNGCIVNITSVSAEVASTNRGDYCMTKAALSMASQLWAVRLAEYGINVYEVRPGIIKTDMTEAVQEKYDRLIEGGLLLQPRWGLPEDVGRVVAMLARGDMPYSTGSVINVDGGFTIPRL